MKDSAVSMFGSETFIEVDRCQICKYKQKSAGDVFFSEKKQSDGRIITTLSDGLGSGIKANVLATLTSTMATKFVSHDIPISRAAEIIMNTLPVDSAKGISYATFTTIAIEPGGLVRIMEYDNPPYLLVRDDTIVEPLKDSNVFERKNKKTGPKKTPEVYYSTWQARSGDRLIFFSDGVSQAGMGSKCYPFGWGVENAHTYTLNAIKNNPEVSARELAALVVKKASSFDNFKPKDDISCGVVYFRNPRDTLVLTGPPMHEENDRELLHIFNAFKGKKIISGGTTANIMARELKRHITVDMEHFDSDVPPFSKMEGVDLITEGIITLGAVADMLEQGKTAVFDTDNAATRMIEILMNSDRIHFVVGTKINEAHQDPNMPESLEIRRNIVKRIMELLRIKYLKEIYVQYL